MSTRPQSIKPVNLDKLFSLSPDKIIEHLAPFYNKWSNKANNIDVLVKESLLTLPILSLFDEKCTTVKSYTCESIAVNVISIKSYMNDLIYTITSTNKPFEHIMLTMEKIRQGVITITGKLAMLDIDTYDALKLKMLYLVKICKDHFFHLIFLENTGCMVLHKLHKKYFFL